MASHPSAAWHPDRSWADPLIALLALLALMAAILALRVRHQVARRPSEQVGLQGRMLEVALAGPTLVGRKTSTKDWAKARSQLKEPWDGALLSVLQAERDLGQGPGRPTPTLKEVPAGPAGERFRRAFLAAYAGERLPDRVDREDLYRRLGNGYAANLLEARLRDREGGGEALRQEARSALLARLGMVSLLGLALLGMGIGGLATGIYLLATSDRKPCRPLPPWEMSGRAAAVVLLVWFLAFFISGNVGGLLLHPWPRLYWLVPCLTYLLHASFGVLLLCRAEGIGLVALWRRVAPSPGARDVAWGGAFLALAVLLVIVTALLSNLLLKPDQSPQRELQDLVRGLSGWGPNLALFLTVAGLAPFFEELMFRGFLLPVLARRQKMALALAASALLFGAIHLQPAGLPTLSSLGLVMGLAMRHTGNLRTPILVHACWNGCLFLLMRAFA
jgi:membrane protease YdiL (CAAX protease family)